MTENERFKIVDEQFISYYGGTGHQISNGECGFWLWHSKTESQKVCDKLNSILDDNEQLKTFKSKVFKLIDDSIKIYEDTTTNDEFLQIQLDTKLQTLYNLRKELQRND